MKDFNARTEGLNNMALDPSIFVESDGAMVVPGLKPGVLLIMQDSGLLKKLGATTITLTNKHKIYYCNSWKDSASTLANAMVSTIPLTKQFDYDITFEKDDADLASSTTFAPGTLVTIDKGKFAVATSTDYVIGHVKAGNATSVLGGTITIATWGGDYIVPGS